MSTQPNPILPWHDDTAVAIMHSDYITIHDIAAIIAAHDPHASQHAETVRLLEDAEETLTDVSMYPKASAYPDGPCLERETHKEVCERLQAIRAQLAEARAEVERLKAEGDKDWRDARAQAIENDQLRAQLAEAHAEMERLKSKHEGISSINSRYREVVEHCKDPNGGPLAVAPEMVMKYVDQLRARVAQLESRLRNPVVETIEHQQGGMTT